MATTVHSTDPRQEVRRHPVRGGIYGFLLGFSVALWLILFAVIPFGDWIVLGVVVLLGIVLGVAWAYLAPAKQPTEPAPTVRPAAPPPTVPDYPATGEAREPTAPHPVDDVPPAAEPPGAPGAMTSEPPPPAPPPPTGPPPPTTGPPPTAPPPTTDAPDDRPPAP